MGSTEVADDHCSHVHGAQTAKKKKNQSTGHCDGQRTFPCDKVGSSDDSSWRNGSDLSSVAGGLQVGTFSGWRPHGVYLRASKEASCWCSPRGGEGTLLLLPRPSWFWRRTLSDKRRNVCSFCDRSLSGAPGSPPATVPSDFMQELARLREIVQDLQREGGNHAGEDVRRKKSLRSLSAPSATQGASGRNPIDDGDDHRSCRVHDHFWPAVDESHVSSRDSRYGLRGVRVGEASHPGPPRLVIRVWRVEFPEWRCVNRTRQTSR